MKRLSLFILLLAVLFATVLPTAAAQSAELPVVRAVIFYSPNCGHCHMVINEILLPLLDEYGDQLVILGFDTSQAAGSQLYQSAIETYQISDERRGVPTLVVHDVVLVGSQEIPDRFPTLIEEGLAAGGIDWPEIPGLAQLISEMETQPSPTIAPPAATRPVSTATPIPGATPTLAPSPAAPSPAVPSPTASPAPAVLTVGEDELPPAGDLDPPPDPLGFALAGAVLVGMVVALGYVAWRIARSPARQGFVHLFSSGSVPAPRVATWAVPLLLLLGLGVASYLAYVELTHVDAVCGPVGKCNIVQASDYALFLGVPVAVWGVLNYLIAAALWAGQKFLPERTAALSTLALSTLLLFGTLFSIYLTCLEIFAIHAICAWCLTSAVVTTVLMLLFVIPLTDTNSASLRRTGVNA